MLCPQEKCKLYDDRNNKRSCYYEPGCWKGYLDQIVEILKLRFKK